MSDHLQPAADTEQVERTPELGHPREAATELLPVVPTPAPPSEARGDCCGCCGG